MLLNQTQRDILQVIALNGPMTYDEIIAQFPNRKATVSGAIFELVIDGYLDVRLWPTDPYTLTTQALEVIGEI